MNSIKSKITLLFLFKSCPIFKMIRGSLDKFPYFFRMGTFIDSTLMKL